MDCNKCNITCKSKRKIASKVRAVHRSLGYYPARFPYCIPVSTLSEYKTRGYMVLDPFIGSGVTCTVSVIYGLPCAGLDINPFSILLAQVASSIPKQEDEQELNKIIKNMYKYNGRAWEPKWRNVDYWHPQPILDALKKIWGFIHYEMAPFDTLAKKIILISLARATRTYSYADPDIPKLYKGKKGIEKIKNIISNNPSYDEIREKILDNVKQNSYKILNSLKNIAMNGGVEARIEEWDTVRNGIPDWASKADIIFTSPPYLAAHEYIRSTKLELYWLGYTDTDIRNLKKKEVPYGPIDPYPVRSETYKKIREYIEQNYKKRLTVYDRYFWALARLLDSISDTNTKIIGLFVGRATIGGYEIPIDTILREHLESLGYKCVCYGEDKIRSRKLFSGRRNLNPKGLRKEILIKLEK